MSIISLPPNIEFDPIPPRIAAKIFNADNKAAQQAPYQERVSQGCTIEDLKELTASGYRAAAIYASDLLGAAQSLRGCDRRGRKARAPQAEAPHPSSGVSHRAPVARSRMISHGPETHKPRVWLPGARPNLFFAATREQPGK
jgi:hypothetical protein